MPPGRSANREIHRSAGRASKQSSELQRTSTVRSGGVRGRLPTGSAIVEAASKPFRPAGRFGPEGERGEDADREPSPVWC